MTPGLRVQVHLAAPGDSAEPLTLLEGFLRDGKPVPPPFAEQFRKAVEKGNLEVLVAWLEDRLVGVVVLAFRLNVSAGSSFAMIEDLYVKPDARRRGVGRMLLEAVEERCRARGVSYVEVQTDEEAAPFYGALGYEPETDMRVLSRSYAL